MPRAYLRLSSYVLATWVSLAASTLLVRCATNHEVSATREPLSSGSNADAGPVSWPSTVGDAMADVATTEPIECARDEDCVPAECCHPTSCVAIARRPACEGVMCTMDCRAGTMDCGGACVCQSGRCAARLAAPPTDAPDASSLDAGAPDASRAPPARRPRRR